MRLKAQQLMFGDVGEQQKVCTGIDNMAAIFQSIRPRIKKFEKIIKDNDTKMNKTILCDGGCESYEETDTPICKEVDNLSADLNKPSPVQEETYEFTQGKEKELSVGSTSTPVLPKTGLLADAQTSTKLSGNEDKTTHIKAGFNFVTTDSTPGGSTSTVVLPKTGLLADAQTSTKLSVNEDNTTHIKAGFNFRTDFTTGLNKNQLLDMARFVPEPFPNFVTSVSDRSTQPPSHWIVYTTKDQLENGQPIPNTPIQNTFRSLHSGKAVKEGRQHLIEQQLLEFFEIDTKLNTWKGMMKKAGKTTPVIDGWQDINVQAQQQRSKKVEKVKTEILRNKAKESKKYGKGEKQKMVKKEEEKKMNGDYEKTEEMVKKKGKDANWETGKMESSKPKKSALLKKDSKMDEHKNVTQKRPIPKGTFLKGKEVEVEKKAVKVDKDLNGKEKEINKEKVIVAKFQEIKPEHVKVWGGKKAALVSKKDGYAKEPIIPKETNGVGKGILMKDRKEIKSEKEKFDKENYGRNKKTTTTDKEKEMNLKKVIEMKTEEKQKEWERKLEIVNQNEAQVNKFRKQKEIKVEKTEGTRNKKGKDGSWKTGKIESRPKKSTLLKNDSKMDEKVEAFETKTNWENGKTCKEQRTQFREHKIVIQKGQICKGTFLKGKEVKVNNKAKKIEKHTNGQEKEINKEKVIIQKFQDIKSEDVKVSAEEKAAFVRKKSVNAKNLIIPNKTRKVGKEIQMDESKEIKAEQPRIDKKTRKYEKSPKKEKEGEVHLEKIKEIKTEKQSHLKRNLKKMGIGNFEKEVTNKKMFAEYQLKSQNSTAHLPGMRFKAKVCVTVFEDPVLYLPLPNLYFPDPAEMRRRMAEMRRRMEMIRMRLCVICKERERRILFHECMHVITCERCAGAIIYCPRCGELVVRKIRLPVLFG